MRRTTVAYKLPNVRITSYSSASVVPSLGLLPPAPATPEVARSNLFDRLDDLLDN